MMPVKTDRGDACGIAQLIRIGWLRPVHCKSLAAREIRALLRARQMLQIKLHDVEISPWGTLHGFGSTIPRGSSPPRRWCVVWPDPCKYQSGETDVTGRISEIGDASERTALYEAADVILERPAKGG